MGRLQDNWLHADLHPGNIIVQTHPGTDLPQWLERAADAALQPLFGVTTRDCMRSITFAIVDVGMVTSMQPAHFAALVDVYQGLASFDGSVVGDAMVRLRHAESTAQSDLSGFRADVTRIFRHVDSEVMHDRTSEVVGKVLDSMRRHRLTLDGAVSTTLITVLTLEGWATKLDPKIRILQTIKGLLPQPLGARLCDTTDTCMAADLLDPL